MSGSLSANFDLGSPEGRIHVSEKFPMPAAFLYLGPRGVAPSVNTEDPAWLRDLAKEAAELADALEARQEEYRAAQAAAADPVADVAVHCGPDAGGAL